MQSRWRGKLEHLLLAPFRHPGRIGIGCRHTPAISISGRRSICRFWTAKTRSSISCAARRCALSSQLFLRPKQQSSSTILHNEWLPPTLLGRTARHFSRSAACSLLRSARPRQIFIVLVRAAVRRSAIVVLYIFHFISLTKIPYSRDFGSPRAILILTSRK